MNPLNAALLRLAFLAFAVGMACLTFALAAHYRTERPYFFIAGLFGFLAAIMGAIMTSNWKK